MQTVAVFPEVRAPRWGKEESEYTLAKKHPPYVYGTSGNACLIHKVNYVQLRWWTACPGGSYLIRLAMPHMTAVTNCQAWYSLNSTGAKTCSVPKPDAVLCAACHGTGRNFPHDRPHAISKALAKVRKGCIAEVSA